MVIYLSHLWKIIVFGCVQNYKNVVENQLNIRISSVMFDYGVVYYTRYDGLGEQHVGVLTVQTHLISSVLTVQTS